MSNLKSFLMFSAVFSVVLSASFVSNSYAETVWLDEQDYRNLAQGDGDYLPTDISVGQEEVSLQPSLGNVAKQDVQTTSEGSFLLPTFVLPEAVGGAPDTVASVDAQNPWRGQNNAVGTNTVANLQNGVALKGVNAPVSKADLGEQDKALLASIEKQYQDTTALLESTAKRLAALETGIENLNQKTIAPPVVTSSVVAAPVAFGQNNVNGTEKQTFTQENCITVNQTPRAPLLLPLAPIKTIASSEMPSSKNVGAKNNAQAAATPAKKEFVDHILAAINRRKARPESFTETDEMILRSIPKEMKISFMPDTADLSAQAFKWIKVFSYNPQRSVISAVEVRLSPENLDLQSRRFALIKGALLSNGVSARQIRFVFSDRDMDSVVLRNIEIQPEQELMYKKGKNGAFSQRIIQKW